VIKKKVKKRESVIREHNAWTMTAAEKHAMIINALRKVSSWWKPMTRTKAAARIGKWIYKCEKCWKEWKEFSPAPPWKKRKVKNFAVDHKISVVGKEGFVSYDTWIERCFIEQWEWLWMLCKECHDVKSKQENLERKKYKDA